MVTTIDTGWEIIFLLTENTIVNILFKNTSILVIKWKIDFGQGWYVSELKHITKLWLCFKTSLEAIMDDEPQCAAVCASAEIIKFPLETNSQ